VENVIEVTMATAGSYLSAGILGYMIGLGMGTVQKGAFANGIPAAFKIMNAKGKEQGAKWGFISACFAGFGSAARAVRGKEDRWNAILGSCGAGALMCEQKTPQAMLTGCVTYGFFSYMLDTLTGGSVAGTARKNSSGGSTDELDFVDVPVAPTPLTSNSSTPVQSTRRQARQAARQRKQERAEQKIKSSSRSEQGKQKLTLRST
jgi:import inner membrane translocase subunit TIM22